MDYEDAVSGITLAKKWRERLFCSAKGKEVMNVKSDTKYIDACKVVKGLDPINGFFVTGGGETQGLTEEASAGQVAENVEADNKKKKEKPKKEMESAGLSPDEKKELESLKEKIVGRKADLKAQGMSGGQQNKDPEIVQWVARMNELKEKEEPGSTQKDKKKDEKKSKNVPLTAEEQKELDNLRGEIETYKHKLKVEFGYSNKDMKADEDLKEMEARLAALEKRA